MMKKATQRTCLVAAVFALSFATSHAQRNLALYSMPGVQQATYVNPGFIPEADVVVGLPIVSNINGGFSNNGFTLEDLGAKGWNLRGLRLDYNELFPLVENSNVAASELSTHLFAIGFRSKNQYFAFESREHILGTAYYPGAAIQLGADLHNGKFEPGLAYNLNDFSYDLTHFRDFSLTYARQFGRASAGVRLRYLVGLENYSTSGPGIVLAATEEMNVFQVDGQLQLWSAGASSLSGDGSYPIGGQGNYGFAFDFGSTYALGEKLTASFSVVNLGGINWTADVRRRMISKEIEDPYNEVEEIFDGFINGNASATLSYNTALPTLIFVGSTYQFSDRSAFYVLANSRYAMGRHNLALALSYSQKIGKPIRASLTYSALKGSLMNIGAGMTIKLGAIQLFGAADNLLTLVTPSTSHNAHINVGINLAFHKKPKPEIPVAAVMPIDSTALAAAQGTARPTPPAQQPVAPNTARPQPPAQQPAAPATPRPKPLVEEPAEPIAAKPQPPAQKPAATDTPKPKPLVEEPAEPIAAKPQPPAQKPAATDTPKPKPLVEEPAEPIAAKPQPPAAEPTAPNTSRPEPASPRPAAPSQPKPSPPRTGPIQYTVIQGAVYMEGGSNKVSHYYFDVYKVLSDGARELVRTGRMPGGDYKLYLDQAFDHEITIKNSDSDPLVLKLKAKELEKSGKTIDRNIILRKASSSGSTGSSIQNHAYIGTKGAGELPAEDLMGLSVPELKQEEAEVIQRPVPKEDPLNLWASQQERSLRLKKNASIYKEMDSGSQVLARLSAGMEIEVLERTTPEWWMVAYRNRIGWLEVSQAGQD
ncbi:MAG: hypothetical protein H6559_08275 [Lewinellaceae bacterium]|nr:hypothetical protein [Lewinellaceae bacterium]